jgi:proteasome beta subunit
VYSFDAAGGKYEEADYQTNGSGGIHARNWIKANWSEGMSPDDAISLAIRALFAAADEDSATGGPDLVRGIYPMVAIIDADGFRLLAEDDVAARAQDLLGGAERGGNESREA